MPDFKLKQGYDILLNGEPGSDVESLPYPKLIGIKPNEFRGIKPKIVVKEGDSVQGGSPLFVSKDNPDFCFTSPVSGKIKEIKRGRKRVLELVSIQADKNNDQIKFKSHPPESISSLSGDELLPDLMKSGMLAVFRQRPFDYVADPLIKPRDIFVSTFDTAPLAPDSNLIIKDNEAYFQAGLDAASRLTDGKVHLSINGKRNDVSNAFSQAKNVEVHRFSGKHPAGCVGVQIHHISPINGRHDVVWYATIQGLVSLGKFIINGTCPTDTMVSVVGSAATDRKYFKTHLGTSVGDVVRGNIEGDSVRYISGNILTGKKVGAAGYVGFYDSMVTIVPEAVSPEFAGWMRPGINKLSFYRNFVSTLLPGKKFSLDTRLNGGIRAFVATGNYEQVLPMKVYPLFLIKSILAGDIEEMEQLGIYEVTEEEVALCEFICPSKADLQDIVRYGLNLIEKEG